MELRPRTPVRVGSGPLLFYEPQRPGCVHWVLDPEAGSGPQVYLEDPCGVEILHRFDRTRLLARRVRPVGGKPTGLYLLDLERHTGSDLLPGRTTELLQVSGERVHFLEVERRDWSGYKIESRAGKLAAVADQHPRYRLWQCDVDGPPSQVWPDAIERVLEVRQQEVWITSADDRGLWRVALDGGAAHRIADIAADWMTSLMTHGFSPDGRRLALGVAHTGDFFGTRDLVVLDVATGARAFQLDGINVREWVGSSDIPRLELTWVDDGTIRFSETCGNHFQWADVRLADGRRLQEKVYSEVWIYHRKPSRDAMELRPVGRESLGLFEHDGVTLSYAGQTDPVDARNDVKNGAYGCVTISPDGRWGTFACSREGLALYLVDGEKRSLRHLTSGWARDVTWMPAVGR